MTAVIKDAGFRKIVEERLRKLEYCGFLVKKEEVYDMSLFRCGDEWGTSRGGQGIPHVRFDEGGTSRVCRATAPNMLLVRLLYSEVTDLPASVRSD